MPPAFVFSANFQSLDPAGRTEKNLARTRAQGRTRAERTRAHSESRAERRGNGAQEIPAARAPAIVDDGTGGIGPQPVSTRIAQRVDALHGESGQILHAPSLLWPANFASATSKSPCGSSRGRPELNCWGEFCRCKPVVSSEKTTRDCGMVAEPPGANALLRGTTPGTSPRLMWRMSFRAFWRVLGRR